ncbi:MAG TPA: hypothetical protein VNJ11_03295 [Bryobacteraceae bacterium]|nr:hypothetical protein [Bryobacteraceae bacterium]
MTIVPPPPPPPDGGPLGPPGKLEAVEPRPDPIVLELAVPVEEAREVREEAGALPKRVVAARKAADPEPAGPSVDEPVPAVLATVAPPLSSPEAEGTLETVRADDSPPPPPPPPPPPRPPRPAAVETPPPIPRLPPRPPRRIGAVNRA